jgi:hypothetical protein
LNSKENNQKRRKEEITPGMVYSRRMSDGQVKEQFKTEEKILGMTPSQALVTKFLDRLLDSEIGERFSAKLNAWLDKNEKTKASGDMGTINFWLMTVAEKALMDADQKKYREGKESIIDWGEKRNMDSYYAMAANMEDKWKAVSLLGARNVDVNVNDLSRSELVDGEALTKFKDTFGEIGDVLYDFAKGVEELSRVKAVRILVPVAAVLFTLTGCGTRGAGAEAIVKTPTFEVFPSAANSEFSTIFTRADLPNVDSQVKDIVERNLDYIAKECRNDNPTMINGSERYIFSKKSSGDVNVWAFCDIKDENGLDQTVVTFFDEFSGQYESSTKINKYLVPLEDGSIGFYDQNGIAHTVTKLGADGFMEVFGFDGRIVGQHKATAKEISFYRNIQSTAEAVLTATPDPTEAPTPTVTVTEQSKYTTEAVAYVPHSVEEIGNSVEVRSPIDDPEGYKEDVEQVLKVIHEQILPNYSGSILKTGDGKIRVGFDSGTIGFKGEMILNPIASTYFEWNGYKVPIFFFPASDSDGKFVFGMVFSPTVDYVNTAGRINNPAPDWHIAELLKRFPMDIVGNGAFEALVFPANYQGDEFMSAYSKVNIEECSESDLLTAFWNLLDKDGFFNRSCEKRPLVAMGGQ